MRFALVLLLSTTAASALAQTVWIDGTGDWFNAANWSAGVPGSSNNGRINNGGTAQITTSGAVRGADLGFEAQDSGTLSVSGAGRLNGEVGVGVSGAGTLDITGGAVVTSGRFVMATNAGSTAIANVTGPGSKWMNSVTCFVGFLGTATLNITNGGEVSGGSSSIAESNGSMGTVTIDGPASKWTLGSTLTVAGNGPGTLTVTNGGKVSSNGTGNFGSVIGRNPGSNGLTTISGVGSAWTHTGPLAVANGFAGTTGKLHIANGGAVSNTYGLLGGPGGNGTAVVEGGGSTWTNNGNLYVAPDSGGFGALTIAQGATVFNANGYVADDPSATGTVVVAGVGSTWTNSGNLYIGGRESAAGGTGILRIENGGTVNASTTTVWTPGTLEIGLNPILNGTLTFNGGKVLPIASITFTKDASLATGGVTVDSNGLDSTFSGTLSGAGGLTKIGLGTLVLTNTNSYTGTTTVTSGRIFANNASGSATGSGTVLVNNPGTVLGGTGLITGKVTITGSAALLGGNASAATGTLTLGSNLTVNSGSVIELVLGGSGAHSTLHRAGGVWSFANNQTFAVVNAGAQPGFYDNIITGLAADPGGQNSWTIAGGAFSGSFIYDGAGNIDLMLSVVPPAPQLVAAASRKTHGGMGGFSVNLPLTGQPGVECRTGGPNGNHTLILTFNNSVQNGNASIATGVGSVTGSPTFNGNTMTVNLTGVTNGQTLTLTLSGVTDSFSQILPDTTLSFAFLLGDSNGDGLVNSGDAQQTRNRSGQLTDGNNFRSDVNADGLVNSGDSLIVRAGSGTFVP